MSQAAVEKALGKLMTDERFRARFFKDPAAASFYAGLELSQAELDALSRLPVEAIARFSACLDHRICRLCFDENGQAAPEERFSVETDRAVADSRDPSRGRRRTRTGGGGEQQTSLDSHG